jgi:hypothetical protein
MSFQNKDPRNGQSRRCRPVGFCLSIFFFFILLIIFLLVVEPSASGTLVVGEEGKKDAMLANEAVAEGRKPKDEEQPEPLSSAFAGKRSCPINRFHVVPEQKFAEHVHHCCLVSH